MTDDDATEALSHEGDPVGPRALHRVVALTGQRPRDRAHAGREGVQVMAFRLVQPASERRRCRGDRVDRVPP